MVGNSIEASLATKIQNGYLTESRVQIAALTIKRFRGSDGNIFVTTDTYFNNTNSLKDSTKYIFNGITYGKGKLVLAVLKQHCERNPTISYVSLELDFPKKCQGSKGVFASLKKAKEIASTDRKRHFINPDEVIKIFDDSIAVSNRWGIGNINIFIKKAIELGYIIETKTS